VIRDSPLAHRYRDHIDQGDESRGKCIALPLESRPAGSGRVWVRDICASICFSSTCLSVAAEAAASAIPTLADARVAKDGAPALASSVPTMAVKVMSTTTLGLVSSK
jgi:hypothetical protein